MSQTILDRATGKIFIVVLLLASAVAAAGQKVDNAQNMPAVGSTTGALTELGNTILNSTASVFDDDPYAQFRAAKYSNDGLMTEAEEIKFGNDLHTEFSKKFKYTNAGSERATRIGLHVAKYSDRPGLPYKFFIVQDKEINAFSAPGGHVYITTALMDLATDDELAAVLSHEIGHVVARHSLKSLQQTQAVDSLASVIGAVTGIAGDDAAALGKLAAQLVASPLVLAHDRDQEREADYLGVHIMDRAGYNPDAMVGILRKMDKISKSNSDLLGSFFDDHPDTNERINSTEFEIKRMKGSETRRQ